MAPDVRAMFCDRPIDGWHCHKGPNHDGPCPSWPNSDRVADALGHPRCPDCTIARLRIEEATEARRREALVSRPAPFLEPVALLESTRPSRLGTFIAYALVTLIAGATAAVIVAGAVAAVRALLH